MRALVCLLFAACTALPATEKHRGMSYAAARNPQMRYGSSASAESLRALKDLGVNWISITPFGFHRSEPSITFGGPNVWETDESLKVVTRQAHELGIKVMLKPHIWGRRELNMNEWSAEQWRSWFDGYAKFIEHYATIARDANVDAFSVGNEQKIASTHDAEWRTMIARVREIYRGPVTYGANFDEVFDVPFWDAVDWIGVSAYFPLVCDATPDRDALQRTWSPILARLEALSKKHRKPVLFTEIGYRSADGAAWRQWEMPRDAPVNLDAQRIAYEAFFEAAWSRPWLLGAYPWKWFSHPDHSNGRDSDYLLENKPALDVIKRHYARGQ